MKTQAKPAGQVVDLLELAPARCVPWLEGGDGQVVIERPRPPIRGLRGLIATANWFLMPRRIRLDEVGSFAWRRLDGSTKVRALAGGIREAFPDSCDQLEERLGDYLKAMRRLRIIRFPEFDR